MNLAAAPALSSKSPEDKPLVKTPVPGTDWIRVKTTQGNTFYSHKAENRNVWVIPDEIKEAAETLEVAERSTEKQEEEATRIETEQMKDQSAKETAERRVHDSVFRDPRDEWLDGLLIGNCDTGKPIGIPPLRLNVYHLSQIPETGPGKLGTRKNGN